MTKIKACLFDLDGVIVDTAVYHFQAWRRLANELGFDFTEHQNEQLKGISRMESLELILKWGNVTLTEAEKLAWATRKNDWYLDLVKLMTPKEVLPGVEKFLTDLREAGIKIALGSASKNSKLILERINMLDYFDAIIDGNNITKGKPDPQVFLMGAEATGTLPSECVVFEDAVAGIQAAKAGGMKAIGVGVADILTEADFVIAGFEEMTLDRLNF
ncbi:MULTISPECIES: beta-phosphoglucomutase [unclassified Arcicella]|uniref:beta-phosphoglucomutase n=1 Tax=unclassified Arcicella TaxID=2644986 RepID=UPI00285FF55C|nr:MULTISPECIES: beta-phosphoglucomutase [unclassified Arcicella]MDR6561644.1 beta-phosphoglucomutase [Arcicella sp. BE51]MDR6812424.1 beta-phosphoglucomutase [Arcicella sp. BE140]MDR6823804.1 beta-phosphoglucomutase [Arcicella sp. BE139]